MTNSNDDSNLDTVLTGTTLKVYKTLISAGRPLGPRELQKTLHLSSPSLATFHLEKLERAGLLTKTEDGSYEVSRVYLKHYVRLRTFLVPRLVFQASLALFFLLGWLLIYSSPNFKTAITFHSHAISSIVLLIFLYGVISAAILTLFFWFETIRVVRQERI